MPYFIVFILLAVFAHGSTSEAASLAALGVSQHAKGDFEAAAKSFEKAASLEPTNAAYHRQFGNAHYAKARKAGPGLSALSSGRKAKAAWDKAIELDPADIEARYNLAEFCLMAPAMLGGGTAKALAHAAAIQKLDPIRSAFAYENIHTHEKKYPEAFAALDEILKVRPDDYLANYRLGRLAALSGQRLDAGLSALKKCLALAPANGAPEHDAAHWRLGNIHEKQGNKAAALAAYEAALAVNPNFQSAKEALAKLAAP